MNELPLRCRCGQVTGKLLDVAPNTVNRVVCYCDDCQTFAHHLDAAWALNEHGGTDISQLPPARMQLTGGHEHVGCVRLSPKGLLRWHTTCCGTPIGNTMPTPTMAFVGVVHCFVDHEALGRDDAMGPPVGHIHTRFAQGDRAALHPSAHDKLPLGVIFRSARLITWWRLRGGARPHPFFRDDGQPIAEPVVLTLEQRKAACPPSA